MRFFKSALLCALLSTGLQVTLVSSAQAQGEALITGAGATFPYPIYSKWFIEYNKANPKVEINYQSIGSGGGIKQLIAKTVDFAASDAPMSDAELQQAGAPVLHLPTVLGAVVLTYNVPDVKQAIKLTPEVIVDMFMGKVIKWNDPKIVELNKGVTFPNKPIIVAYRSDSSGTTSVFTEYLAKVSPEWKSKVGAGKAVKWPVGVGGKGNEGVTGFVKNTPGALGYVEFVYAQSEKLPVAEVKNAAGQFVAPSLKGITDAAAGSLKNLPEDLRVSITNAEGKTAYPISAFTYLLVFKTMDKAKGGEFVKFLNWAMDKGQVMAANLQYAPLPKPVLEKVKAKIKTIELK